MRQWPVPPYYIYIFLKLKFYCHKNKWSISTSLGIFIVSLIKQIECILNDTRVYEHNQNTVENRNVLCLLPCVTTSCDRLLAFSAHTHDQRLYVPLWYPIASSLNALISSCLVRGGFSLPQSRHPSWSHRCSIGLRSGEKAGHGNTDTPSTWK